MTQRKINWLFSIVMALMIFQIGVISIQPKHSYAGWVGEGGTGGGGGGGGLDLSAVAQDYVPATDNAWDLGTALKNIADIHMANDMYVDTGGYIRHATGDSGLEFQTSTDIDINSNGSLKFRVGNTQVDVYDRFFVRSEFALQRSLSAVDASGVLNVGQNPFCQVSGFGSAADSVTSFTGGGTWNVVFLVSAHDITYVHGSNINTGGTDVTVPAGSGIIAIYDGSSAWNFIGANFS